MYPYTRINASSGPRWRNRLSPVLPWIFVLGVVAGTMLPIRRWVNWPSAVITQTSLPSATDARAIWARAANLGVRHPVDIVRTIDGDTFEALVHLWPGLDMTTRVRLRGVDAAEMKAACPEELRLAKAARAALRDLLGEGGVTIANVGPDKYHGRVVADAATARTPDVSASMLASGYVRAYHGGRRGSWCNSASRCGQPGGFPYRLLATISAASPPPDVQFQKRPLRIQEFACREQRVEFNVPLFIKSDGSLAPVDYR